MKRIFVLVLVLVVFYFKAEAQETGKVKWHTFEEAVSLNKENPRKLFIDVYTDWCGWCKKMDKDTFTDPVIAEILNSQYYAIKFNAESKEPVNFAGTTYINEGNKSRSTHQLAIALLQGQMSYPSAAYMTEDMQLLTAVPGYFTAKNLEPILNFFATDTYKNISYQAYVESFEGKVH